MEQITLSLPATRNARGHALAGVVGSGDMEVLFSADEGKTLSVEITTSVDNSQADWRRLKVRSCVFFKFKSVFS